MKTTKIILCMTLLLLGVQYSKAQDEMRIGGMLAYGTEVENIGIGVTAAFPIMDKMTIAPSFIFYLPKDEFGVKINWFELNANANYYFLDEGNLDVYGLGGLNFSSVSVKYDNASIYGSGLSASDGRVGLNLGGGANFDIGTSFLLFSELKYVIIDQGQLVIAAGVKFSL
ncbi:outer membrane beta-barrel protein [Maribacter sp. MMG018]|uniref:outer membrane protein n=1 Tax=Maribacter sp. MMG018 TaxID=2822688 RepID=UPI001B397D27|nr:outer membrane beta-barrel protein [Maribacter sp. MMG018]MBQ4913927.1 outer membrane beta-barrel protein [Maribacter sp. MMG018]